MTAGSAPSSPPRRIDRRRAFFAAVALFLIECAIALFVEGGFVRQTLGDVLAVVLVSCLILAATRTGSVVSALVAFAIACLAETAQAFDVVRRLGLEGNMVARTVVGATFDWGDILAYAAGAVVAATLGARALRRR